MLKVMLCVSLQKYPRKMLALRTWMARALFIFLTAESLGKAPETLPPRPYSGLLWFCN